MGKVIMEVGKIDVLNTAGGIRLCAGHEAGAEADDTHDASDV